MKLVKAKKQFEPFSIEVETEAEARALRQVVISVYSSPSQYVGNPDQARGVAVAYVQFRELVLKATDSLESQEGNR